MVDAVTKETSTEPDILNQVKKVKAHKPSRLPEYEPIAEANDKKRPTAVRLPYQLPSPDSAVPAECGNLSAVSMSVPSQMAPMFNAAYGNVDLMTSYGNYRTPIAGANHGSKQYVSPVMGTPLSIYGTPNLIHSTLLPVKTEKISPKTTPFKAVLETIFKKYNAPHNAKENKADSRDRFPTMPRINLLNVPPQPYPYAINGHGVYPAVIPMNTLQLHNVSMSAYNRMATVRDGDRCKFCDRGIVERKQHAMLLIIILVVSVLTLPFSLLISPILLLFIYRSKCNNCELTYGGLGRRRSYPKISHI